MYVFLSLQDGVCLEKRQAESLRIMEKYPDRIHVCSVLLGFLSIYHMFILIQLHEDHESLMTRGKIRSLACMLLITSFWFVAFMCLYIADHKFLNILRRIVTDEH